MLQSFSVLDERIKQLEKGFGGIGKKANSAFGNIPGAGAIKEAEAIGKLQAKYQELKSASNTLRQALTTAYDPRAVAKYTGALADAEKGLARLRRAGQDVGVDLEKGMKKASEAAKGFSSFGVFKGAFAALSVDSLLDSLKATTTEAINTARAFDQDKKAIEVFTGSADKAAKLLSDLSKSPLQSAFDPAAVTSAAKSLLGFNVEADQVPALLEKIGTVSKATGRDFGELAVLIGKMKVQQVLFSEDLNQLLDSGLPVLDEFAKILGVSADQIKKLASSGKINFSVLEKALTNLTSAGGKYFGLLQSGTKGASGGLNDFSIVLTQIKQKIGETLLPIVSKIGGGLASLARALHLVGSESRAAVNPLEATRQEFNAEIEVLKRGNFTQKERAQVIREINSKYKDYLPSLLSEKASIEEIGKAQAAANKEFLTRIVLLDTQKEIEERAKRGVDAAKNAIKLTKEAAKLETSDTQDNARFGEILKGRSQLLQNLAADNRNTAESTGEDINKIKQDAIGVAEQMGLSADRIKKALAGITGFETSGAAGGATSATLKKTKEDAEKLADELEALKIQAMKDGEAKEIAQEDEKFRLLKRELDKHHLDTTQAEAQHLINLFNIREDFAEKRLEQDRKFEEERAQFFEDIRSDRLDTIAKEKQDQDAVISLGEAKAKAFLLRLKAQGASEKEVAAAQTEFDLQTQKARLENDLAFEEKRLAAIGDADAEVIDQIKQHIEQLKADLGNVDFQIDNPAEDKGDDKPKSVWALLGITDDPEGQRILDEAAGRIKAAFDDITQARIDAANTARQLADQQVEDAESALDREIQLAELGFASDVTLKRKQLEEAKKAQAAAIEEQRKAARQKAIADAAQQISSLLVAGAEIFQAHAGIPFAGPVIAAGLIATMIATFNRLKAQTKAAAVFREGGEARISRDGILVGPSHENKGIGIEAEGGEAVFSDGRRLSIVNKGLTSKHFDLITAINKDDRAGIFRYAFALSGLDYGAVLRAQPGIDYGRENLRLSKEAAARQQAGSSGISTKAIEEKLDKANASLKSIDSRVKKLEERPQVLNGGRTIVKGNMVKTILNP